MKKDWHYRVRPLPLRTESTNYSPSLSVMPSPQRRKGTHRASRKFPRKHTTTWNSNRPTPDGEVNRSDRTPNMTSPDRTLMMMIVYSATDT